MSYQFQRWAGGDDVTIARLNKIENAVAGFTGGGMVVTGTMSDNVFTLNTPFQDIQDAFLEGRSIVINVTPRAGSLSYDKIVCMYEKGFASQVGYFSVNSSGYPVYVEAAV